MELKTEISDIEKIIRVITECKKAEVELVLLVTMRRESSITIRTRNVRKKIIQEILYHHPEGLTIMQLLRRYNYKRRKINRKTLLRDCFFLYNDKKIQMELLPRKIGGYHYVVKLNDIKQSN